MNAELYGDNSSKKRRKPSRQCSKNKDLHKHPDILRRNYRRSIDEKSEKIARKRDIRLTVNSRGTVMINLQLSLDLMRSHIHFILQNILY